MKVNASMTTENEFRVNEWWAKSPEFVIDALRRQLLAAQAIWPVELADYAVGVTALRSPEESK